MAKVVNVPDEGDLREGESCLIVSRDASGRFYQFSSFAGYRAGTSTSAEDVDEEHLAETITRAVAHADRYGIPTVYVDRR